nr:lytic transglycosylase domain-containing protein [Clostridia bacterium]
MNEFYNHPKRDRNTRNSPQNGTPNRTNPHNTQNGTPGTPGQNRQPPMQYRQPQYSQPPVYQSQPVQSVRRRRKRRPIVIPVLISIIAVLLLTVGIGIACDYLYTEYEKRTHPLEYTSIVQRASAEFGVPEYVIYAVIKTESSFRADAVSYRGAVGLMQIMPETYEWLTTHTKEEHFPDRLSDPEINIRYGTYFLAWLYEEFGSWDLVYAAYNAGFVRVRGWLEDPEYSENGALTDIPIEETRNYVVKVGNAVEVYRRLYEM